MTPCPRDSGHCFFNNQLSLIKMNFKYLALMLSASVLLGCGNRRGSSDDTSASGFTVSGDLVTIDKSSPVAGRIKVEDIRPEELGSGFSATASVSPRPDSYAEVGVPFGGRITRSLVRLGDRVRRGQVLYEMSSADFMEAVREYVQNSNEASVAASNLRRKKALHDAGIVPDKELEEAVSASSDADAALELSRQVLSIVGTDPSSVRVGQPLRVVSPISGTVVRNDLVIGQILSDDDEAPVAVADLSTVWVTANVRESLAWGITKGEDARIEAAGHPSSEGKVCYVGEMLDDKTRTVPVVVECPNPDRILKPGMFVTARFPQVIQGAVTVPSTAVFQGQNSKFVYVRQDGLTFRKVPVEIQSLEDGRLLVTSGLEGGESIIADGGIYLSQ